MTLLDNNRTRFDRRMTAFDDRNSIGNQSRWEVFCYLISVWDFKAAFWALLFWKKKK